jgi:hypothetical protein
VDVRANAATSGRTVSTASTLSRSASKSPKLLLTDRPSSSPAGPGRGRQTTGWSRRWRRSGPALPLPGRFPNGWRFEQPRGAVCDSARHPLLDT